MLLNACCLSLWKKKKNQVFPVLGAGIDFQKEKKKSPTRVKFVHIRISLKTKTKHLSAVAQFSLFSEGWNAFGRFKFRGKPPCTWVRGEVGKGPSHAHC